MPLNFLFVIMIDCSWKLLCANIKSVCWKALIVHSTWDWKVKSSERFEERRLWIYTRRRCLLGRFCRFQGCLWIKTVQVHVIWRQQPICYYQPRGSDGQESSKILQPTADFMICELLKHHCWCLQCSTSHFTSTTLHQIFLFHLYFSSQWNKNVEIPTKAADQSVEIASTITIH